MSSVRVIYVKRQYDWLYRLIKHAKCGGENETLEWIEILVLFACALGFIPVWHEVTAVIVYSVYILDGLLQFARFLYKVKTESHLDKFELFSFGWFKQLGVVIFAFFLVTGMLTFTYGGLILMYEIFFSFSSGTVLPWVLSVIG